MEATTQDVPGYYVWEAPGAPVSVHLHLNVVDKLLPEVIRGFGAVPKRGAEVGGILVGVIEPCIDQTIVRVQDVDLVECAYKRGPSYVFTEEDGAAFAEACRRCQPTEGNTQYALGYFRSHTRDGLLLSTEDIFLLEEYFQEPWQIALLIKPYATKPSRAGFFFRDAGIFRRDTPLTFPFRRRELSGEEPEARRALGERTTERRPRSNTANRERRPRDLFTIPDSEIPREPAELNDIESETREERPRFLLPNWTWIPLSFLFLLLGVLLGFQAAQTFGSRAMNQDFSLALNVTQNGDNLTVRWNREAQAIRNAQRGVLEIQDGGYSKPVELDAAHLQNGTIIYRNSSKTVQFRLVVYENARTSIAEMLEWRQ